MAADAVTETYRPCPLLPIHTQSAGATAGKAKGGSSVILHLIYSIVAYVVFAAGVTTPHRFTLVTTCTDVLFAGAIAFVTEGKGSLFYPFFTFAIVETGLVAGFRRIMVVTAASVGLSTFIAIPPCARR